MPADVELSRYGPRLSALVGLLGSAFPLSFSKTQALLDQLLGVKISRGAIAAIRRRLSAAGPADGRSVAGGAAAAGGLRR